MNPYLPVRARKSRVIYAIMLNTFCSVHPQITVPITKTFIEFLKTQPIIFKVFGHYQHHPLHNIAKQEFATRPPPRRMLPPSIPISQPVRSPKFGPLPCPPSSTVLAKHDILVWFEICELAPSGEYVPSVVEHSDDLPCRGLFLLHQGIQRRIRITIVHEPTPEIKWKDIRELVVGESGDRIESNLRIFKLIYCFQIVQ